MTDCETSDDKGSQNDGRNDKDYKDYSGVKTDFLVFHDLLLEMGFEVGFALQDVKLLVLQTETS